MSVCSIGGQIWVEQSYNTLYVARNPEQYWFRHHLKCKPDPCGERQEKWISPLEINTLPHKVPLSKSSNPCYSSRGADLPEEQRKEKTNETVSLKRWSGGKIPVWSRNDKLALKPDYTIINQTCPVKYEKLVLLVSRWMFGSSTKQWLHSFTSLRLMEANQWQQGGNGTYFPIVVTHLLCNVCVCVCVVTRVSLYEWLIFDCLCKLHILKWEYVSLCVSVHHDDLWPPSFSLFQRAYTVIVEAWDRDNGTHSNGKNHPCFKRTASLFFLAYYSFIRCD